LFRNGEKEQVVTGAGKTYKNVISRESFATSGNQSGIFIDVCSISRVGVCLSFVLTAQKNAVCNNKKSEFIQQNHSVK